MEYKPEDILEIFIQDWPDIDAAIKTISKSKIVLRKYYQAALQNKLQHWRKTARGKLALILVYDQAPRFIFGENNPKIYGTDKLAREITAEMFGNSEYKKLSPLEIMFAFFPYHHSENMEHQKIAKSIFKKLYEKNPEKFEWIYQSSKAYNKLIARFGRFPHRNKILGRKSTDEEKEFLEKQ
jgi:uncharacterized protein (DUF924 family)